MGANYSPAHEVIHTRFFAAASACRAYSWAIVVCSIVALCFSCHAARLFFERAGSVALYARDFSAPAEAPTTRGFASILAAGLDEQPADAILAVPEDFYTELGLAALISPLRLRGMSAMLARIKRRLR